MASVVWGEMSNEDLGQFCYTICSAFIYFFIFIFLSLYTNPRHIQWIYHNANIGLSYKENNFMQQILQGKESPERLLLSC